MTAAERIQEKIQKLRALHENATRDWVYDERTGMVAVYPGEKRNCLMRGGYFVARHHYPPRSDGTVGYVNNKEANADLELLAQMRNALPALLDVADAALEAQKDQGWTTDLETALDRLGEPNA